jgi:protein-tyrosine phosphatase
MAHLIRQSTSHRESHGGSLWQGGADDVTKAHGEGFQVVVLCAEEFQPARHIIATEDMEVIHAPNDDSEKPLTRDQLTTAIAASRVVASRFRQGKKVLVSCMQGRNRSGLVTALALHRIYGMAGERCRGYIRSKVPHALTNPSFNKFLDTLKARDR